MLKSLCVLLDAFPVVLIEWLEIEVSYLGLSFALRTSPAGCPILEPAESGGKGRELACCRSSFNMGTF